VIILLFANLLRIAGLYLAGLYFSDQVFEVLHIQGGFIFFTFAEHTALVHLDELGQ
jgi:exosortase/archaeosortase family protein